MGKSEGRTKEEIAVRMAQSVYIPGGMPTAEEIQSACSEAIRELERNKRTRFLLLLGALTALVFTAIAAFFLGRVLGENFHIG